MTIEAKIWFSSSGHQSWFVQTLYNFIKNCKYPFPFDKANAIRVTAHNPGNPNQPIFPVRTGETKLFKSPEFAIHQEAWAVGNVEVEIGPIKKTNIGLVDEFNQLIMDFFNLGSGNMLQAGNLLSWNVWFREPGLVDKEEWRAHAERWRESIDEEHRSPDGEGTNPKYFDGTEFNPVAQLIEEKIHEIISWILEHLPLVEK
jgi:hypothetical protein